MGILWEFDGNFMGCYGSLMGFYGMLWEFDGIL